MTKVKLKALIKSHGEVMEGLPHPLNPSRTLREYAVSALRIKGAGFKEAFRYIDSELRQSREGVMAPLYRAATKLKRSLGK